MRILNSTGRWFGRTIAGGIVEGFAFLAVISVGLSLWSWLKGATFEQAALLGLFAIVLLSLSLYLVSLAVPKLQGKSPLVDETRTPAAEKTKLHENCERIISNHESTIRRLRERNETRDVELSARDSQIEQLEERLSGLEWLRQIAATQAAHIASYVYVNCSVQEHRQVGNNPYVDLCVSFQSHCVYKLTLSYRLEGHIHCERRLVHAPILIKNAIKDLRMDETRSLELHQPLTEQEAADVLTWQSSFNFYGLTVYLSGNPGIEERPFELTCVAGIDQRFIDDNYPKVVMDIEPSGLRSYFRYRKSDQGTDLPTERLGTVLTLSVRLQNPRPLKVRQFKLVTSGPVAIAQTGEICETPHRDASGYHVLTGEKRYPNLADLKIDVERGNITEGWLQFLVPGVEPEKMLDPSKFIVRLHVVDESGEEHRQDVTGFQLIF